MATTNGHKLTALERVLGQDRFERVQKSKLLVVGAGGIGCELLKNMVLSGFQDIEVIDLDTIDISNLNRQFLFRRNHVDRPKAVVAAEVVRQFNPNVKITAHHGNIKDPQYGVDYFSKFDVVVNALDNLDARRHVNRVCLAADKPLLEAGSTGHLGQVTVIKKGETECFECQAKPTQKVYPYCTIRSTPEKPVHCLTWAKNLFDLCFGPDDESNLLADLAEDMKRFREEGGDGEVIGKKIFEHLFNKDIQKQAGLEDLWSEKRPPPEPLGFDSALKRTEVVATSGGDKALEVQKVPTIAADAEGFVTSVACMFSERKDTIGSSTFSKDDRISMDFVHRAANLRMTNYRIGRLSRWDAQSIAGAIIPAVASTNAIVAGLEVVQLFHVIDALAEGKKLSESRCRTVWVRYPEPSRKKILQPSSLQGPNKQCFVCGSSTLRVKVKSLTDMKIGAFAKACVQSKLGASRPSLTLGANCIFDPDYPEASEEAAEEGLHPEWSLAKWDIINGAVLSVEDEGQGFSCNIIVTEDPEMDEESFPEGIQVEAGEVAEAKRKAEEAAKEEPAAKASKTAAEAVALDD